ncbi:hypothetical protein [Pseudoxanthomonas indica]|uniref:Uncharacterized protein n=1 Tax=Pseudoxanthomonas indica TaxID=428993 RepID=A0A1T5K1L1_9GAMM|nr:hypothetical protein [Pseudoxanthomonas indica]GGD45845.1 hypothetical protein GCM10007235_17290 [Pseudoxanthomonas indica]SKC57430.1 hypothetical protein SAMN06296058_1268 [Pseudoxanthomonas indica]
MSIPIDDKINLKMYVSALEAAAHAKTDAFASEGGTLTRIARELLDAGLLSDARTELGSFSLRSRIVLTPAGASALVEWSDYLQRRTWRARLLAVLGQVLLVLTGAVATSLPDWFA